MFTGLVQALGAVQHCTQLRGDHRLTITAPEQFMKDVVQGDSIAVNGICLTVTQCNHSEFNADVSVETAAHTTVKKWRPGHRVNLEKALSLVTRLGGHIVTGHVDGVGRVVCKTPAGRSWQIDIEAPSPLHRYLAPKGSVTVDGVSLTVNRFRKGVIALNIVPHTLKETTLELLVAGSEVHLEVDILARYTEHLLSHHRSDTVATSAEEKISRQLLAEHGFLR